jgi:hypothetical protein
MFGVIGVFMERSKSFCRLKRALFGPKMSLEWAQATGISMSFACLMVRLTKS